MPEDVDCIMVLGCGLKQDGEPTRMLRDRLDQGIALYQAGAAPKLLMSGDHGRVHYDEVNKMKEYAMEQVCLRRMYLWIMQDSLLMKVCTGRVRSFRWRA